MLNIIYPIITLLSLCCAAICLIKLAALRKRHRGAKAALNRVAGERDEARFKMLTAQNRKV